MPNVKFSNKFKRLSNLADSWLLSQVDKDCDRTELWSAARYALLSPGKRFRPVLALLGAEVLGVTPQLLSPYCVALEYVHAASLVHDDLPSLDDDDLRRGMSTVHKAFREDTAVLVGDLLFIRALGILAESKRIPDITRISLVKLLSSAMVKLCEGQMMDLRSGEKTGPIQMSLFEQDPEKMLLKRRHLLKTGALIAASLAGPAYFLPLEKCNKVVGPLFSFSNKLGLLYQIVDDIIDVISGTEVLGKTSSSDARQGTITYVSLYGLDGANKLADRIAKEAITELKFFGSTAEDLANLVKFVRKRNT